MWSYAISGGPSWSLLSRIAACSAPVDCRARGRVRKSMRVGLGFVCAHPSLGPSELRSSTLAVSRRRTQAGSRRTGTGRPLHALLEAQGSTSTTRRRPSTPAAPRESGVGRPGTRTGRDQEQEPSQDGSMHGGSELASCMLLRVTRFVDLVHAYDTFSGHGLRSAARRVFQRP